MIKNKQLIIDKNSGDCFRACLTSLLGIPNSNDLPNVDSPKWLGDWYTILDQWGLLILYSEKTCWIDGYWIASVPSLNFKECTHSIIMNGVHVVHDPSPLKVYESDLNLIGENIVIGGYKIVVKDFEKLTNWMGVTI